MHSVILETARATPDRPAVIGPDATLTYRGLVRQAAAIAGALRGHGVVAGDRVGVLLAPSPDAVAAMVAVLMLRAAYVPVDPAQPAQRVRAMLANCTVRACVAGARHPELDCPVVDPSTQGTPAEPVWATENEVAYVIHTSGSTGTPKGVEIEHRGVLNLLADLDRIAPVADGYRGSWWTQPSFDVSVWESWAPLSRGGTVVVVPPEYRLEGPRLMTFLDSADVNSAYIPAAFLPDLLDRLRADEGSFRSLTRLLVGVEPIPLGLVQDLMRERPGLRVVNGYGPAETTICCTLYAVPPTGGIRAQRTPIGTAVAGNRLYVLDDRGDFSATGAGELVVAGIGVARGYLGASTDAARFVADPAGGRERAYRTGDLVRTLPDGNLVFEGRVDRQLKVRGYRVEPGEVEAALREAAPVRDVVVNGRDGMIVAYLVPEMDAVFDERSTRRRLAEILPAHAVPAVIMVVESIPLTRNGKVDHDALPMPGSGGGDTAVDLDGSLLDVVLGVWRTVLDARDVQPGDGFAQLGGSSLAAARVAAQLRSATGRAVSAVDILRATTATELTAVLSVADPLCAEAPTDIGREHGPLSPAQLGLWIHDQLGESDQAYVETACFEVDGDLKVDVLESAVARAAAAHPVFGASIRTERGVPILELCGRQAEMTRHDLPEDAVGHRLLTEAGRRFDLQTDPLMRCLLLRRSPRRWLLLFAWHHLVVDGWSLRLFLRDLAYCYRDPDHVPAANRTTVCDLNHRQIAAAATPRGRTQLDRAVARLAGMPLVIDWPCGAQSGAQAAVLPFRLPGQLIERVEQAAARGSLTVSATVGAAYQRALAAVLGLERFVLGCAVNGRTDPDAGSIAGYLVNTVLLRCEHPRNGTAEAFAGELAAALHDQDVPFAHLVKQLLRGAGKRPNSFPQLYFSLDAEPDLQLDHLDCRQRPLHPVRAKFDLSLSLQHSPGRLGGVLEYRTAVVSPSTATDLIAAFGDELAAQFSSPADRPSRELVCP